MTQLKQIYQALNKSSRLEMLSPSEEVAIQISPPKKIRRGYLKREAARIVADHVNEQFKEAEMELEETTVHEVELDEGAEPNIAAIHPLPTSVGCQVNKKTNKSHHRKVWTTSIGVQTEFVDSRPVMKDSFQLVRPDYFEVKTE